MHNKIKGRKLGRTTSHKKALLRNLANQIIEHKEIRTTTAKAKEARSYVERLITYAKKGDVHHRRLAFAFLRNKQSINILFDEIAPVYSDRQGGYTRVVKLGNRLGDAAAISLLQLVDFEKTGDAAKKKTEKKKDKASAKVAEKVADQKADKDVKQPEKSVADAETKIEKEELDKPVVEKEPEAKDSDTSTDEETKKATEEKALEKPDETDKENLKE